MCQVSFVCATQLIKTMITHLFGFDVYLQFRTHQAEFYAATLQGKPRTNNMSVCFNNKLFKLVGHQHPSVRKLIECLKAETTRVTGALLQLKCGVRPKKRFKRVYVELQSRFKNLCEDRVEGRKSVAEFLRAVSHNIRAGQPNI